MQWQWLGFDELTVEKLYALLKLRQDVFVLEQECLYGDLDNLDQHCTHLLALDGNKLAAYLRIIPACHHASGYITLGRILTSADYRGQSLGKEMMQQTMSYLRAQYPGQVIHMSAQCYLEKFYANFGFNTMSEPYDDDGIMHIDMQTQIS